MSSSRARCRRPRPNFRRGEDALRVLAIDLGSKRIGLALSDEGAVIAQPLNTVPAQPVARLPERLGGLARDLGVGEIVVGLPKRLDGSQGPEAKAARVLAGR